jgi:prepilin-type N-terminal cleavage/methylation domain-containing protein
MRALRHPAGFSLVEVVVALVILAIGILAMAGTTDYIHTRSRDAEVDAARALAVQQAVERLRASAYADVVDRAASQADTIGSFRVWWTVNRSTAALKQVLVVSEGPGYVSGHWAPAALDTTVVSIFDSRS